MAAKLEDYIDALLTDRSIEVLKHQGETQLRGCYGDEFKSAKGKHTNEGQSRNSGRQTPERNKPNKLPPGTEFVTETYGFKTVLHSSKIKSISDCLDFGDGVIFKIPPYYDKMASLFGLPTLDDVYTDKKLLENGFDEKAAVELILDEKSKQENRSLRESETKKAPLREFLNLDVFIDKEKLSSGGNNAFLEDESIENRSHSATPKANDWQSVENQAIALQFLRREQHPAVSPVRVDADAQKNAWLNVVQRDLPRWHRIFFTIQRKHVIEAKRVSELCQREVRNRLIRSVRVARQAPMRTRRLARDMILLWKKIDREQAEIRKREEKEAQEARKREEEMREARRQQQRLNFLITQTELYSHFMQTKAAGPAEAKPAPTAAESENSDDLTQEERAEVENMKAEAALAAKNAAKDQLLITNKFDAESNALRAGGEDALMDQAGGNEAAADMDLLNPSTMPAMSSVSQPKMFQGTLKEYQLKGLQWLVNLYEQGLNGILADEMGLGKTIQAMSFLSHLAEEKNIWGPFLVVAPASVLSNWADELAKFLPNFKVLPYWGGMAERGILRKNINPKKLYRKEASFHVLITSYQLMVSDEKHFKRVKWQYMILDEAQAIKSASSLRWKALLSFNCRNRLLLTGTPIQNNMAELWALLHFIMPTLFDSHEQFNEWFSKGIEGHAEHGGTLNEHQLSRLHSILKPFMLRRVKRDVEVELSGKVEVTVQCPLSNRQTQLYNGIKHNISVADLFDSVGNGGQLSDKKVLHLMNIVIQLRKVCNHPELFERNEGKSYFFFSDQRNALLAAPFGELDAVWMSGSRSAISYNLPRLVFEEGMFLQPFHWPNSPAELTCKWLYNRLALFDPENVWSASAGSKSGAFGFLSLIDLSPAEFSAVARASLLHRWLFLLKKQREDESRGEPEPDSWRAVRKMLLVPRKAQLPVLRRRRFMGSILESLAVGQGERMLNSTRLLRCVQGFSEPALAPQVEIVCPSRSFAYRRAQELYDPWTCKLLIGQSRSWEGGPRVPDADLPVVEELGQSEALKPLCEIPFRVFGSSPYIETVDIAKLLTDSGKLHTLDRLLRKLRAEGHRVLVFAQMTKMLNILEDYMNFRKYKYLRLDGSSTIVDRRDMVKDFQKSEDIFVFLLSTRAGGLGINLTAADTVIFYESDWNPTMDLQAMDRAHRLGQTREVTVYRLICESTVEEKIVKRASQKNTVQQLVMTGGRAPEADSADVFNAEEVVSLLLDDAELEAQLKRQQAGAPHPDKVRRRRGFLGGTSKNIRLDAEGFSFVEDNSAPAEEVAANGGAPSSQPGDEVAPGDSKAKRKRKSGAGDEKPPKPPKVPKVPKAPKAPKAPKEKAPPEKKKEKQKTGPKAKYVPGVMQPLAPVLEVTPLKEPADGSIGDLGVSLTPHHKAKNKAPSGTNSGTGFLVPQTNRKGKGRGSGDKKG